MPCLRNSPSTYIQLLFYNVSDLLDVRKDVFEYLKTNSTNSLCIPDSQLCYI